MAEIQIWPERLVSSWCIIKARELRHEAYLVRRRYAKEPLASPSLRYSAILDEQANQWESASRNFLANQPQIHESSKS